MRRKGIARKGRRASRRRRAWKPYQGSIYRKERRALAVQDESIYKLIIALLHKSTRGHPAIQARRANYQIREGVLNLSEDKAGPQIRHRNRTQSFHGHTTQKANGIIISSGAFAPSIPKPPSMYIVSVNNAKKRLFSRSSDGELAVLWHHPHRHLGPSERRRAA